MLAVLAALIAAGMVAWLLLRPTGPVIPPVAEQAEAQTPASLSQPTLDVLGRIGSPVEVRFYTMLDNPDVPEPIKEYAGRVEELLALYEKEGAGKIKVVMQTSMEDLAQKAAQADGMRAIAAEDRAGAYLGIAVARGDQRVALPELTPQWEQALEPDITRAIIAVTSGRTSSEPLPPAVAQEQRSAVETVRAAVPNLDSMTLAEAKKALREASLAELERVTKEQQAAVKAVEARVLQTQSGGSQTERQQALEELRAVRQQYTDKLLEIAAGLQAQTTALEKLKSR